jgi:predicted anti-sigma-YlaC factor YlaD
MDCLKFQDSLSDYLEGALESRLRAECAAHRLVCGECRELYDDVRATVRALNSFARREIAEPEGLRNRILDATTTGEMLSCGEFDRLLERYFDGVILAPTFQTFQTHFENCAKCRRLLNGIEEAIAMCREVKEAEIEAPNSLYDRIIAATIGVRSVNWFARARSALFNFARPLLTPQMAVGAMIIAAISLLVLSRFGSVANLTEHAEQKAESIVSQGQQKIRSSGAMARSGLQRVSFEVNSFLFSGGTDRGAPAPTRPSPIPAGTGIRPSEPVPRPRPEAESERDQQQQRQNQNRQKQ